MLSRARPLRRLSWTAWLVLVAVSATGAQESTAALGGVDLVFADGFDSGGTIAWR